MLSFRSYLLLTALMMCLSATLLAQTTGFAITEISNLTSTPIAGSGHDYLTDLSEIVNPANGSVSIRIAAPTPHERQAAMPIYAYTYDTNGQFAVTFETRTSQIGGPNSTTYEQIVTGPYLSPPNVYGVWGSFGAGYLSYQKTNFNYCSNPTSSGGCASVINCNLLTSFTVVDPSGGRHSLGVNVEVAGLPSENCLDVGVPPSNNAGGDEQYKIDTSCRPAGCSVPASLIVTDLHGDGLGSGFEDTNGNQLNTDGRTWSFPYSYQYVPGWVTPSSMTFPGFSNAYTYGPYAGGSGTATLQATLRFNEYSSTYPEDCVSVPSNSIIGQGGTSSVTLPTGQQYSFTYDPAYGLINTIGYPSGATVTYTWGTNPQSEIVGYQGNYTAGRPVVNTSPECIYTIDTPAVQKRVVSYDGVTPAQEQDFAYSSPTWNSNHTAWTKKTTTVTTIDLIRPGHPSFTTVYTYLPMQSANQVLAPSTTFPVPLLPVESTVAYYDTSGALLRTVTKKWNTPNQLAAECTTLDNGQTSGIFYQYATYSWGSITAIASQTSQAFATSLITDRAEYDYGAVGSSCQQPSSTPLREIKTTYASLGQTPWWQYAPALVDRPQTVQVYGNGTLVSETDYAYDGTAPSSVSPAPYGHDETNYGPSPSGTWSRGNATTITRKCFIGTTSCTNSVWTIGYDTTGQPITVIDANNNISVISYTDTFASGTGSPPQPTNAYVTKVTKPVTNGISHVETFQWNYNQGELAVLTDENGKNSYFYYSDPWNRLTEADYPDGGVTKHAYVDSAPISVTTCQLVNGSASAACSSAAPPSGWKTTVAFKDGVGHVVQATLPSDPEGSDITDTKYDGLGRVYTQSNPHRSSSSTTDGTTTYTYDALGRLTELLRPDNSDVDSSYSGNCTTVVDEVGSSRRSCVDALGHVLEVDEPGAGASYGNTGSGTVTIGGSEQTGGGTSGSATATISNKAACVLVAPNQYAFEGGTVSISVNGSGASQSWSGTCSGLVETISPSINQIATNLASTLSSSSAGVTASVTGTCTATSTNCSITITATTTGSSTNYPLSSSYTIGCQNHTCPNGSGVIPTTPSSLSGGSDSSADSGTVSLTVNGTTYTATYGAGSNAQQIANTLSALFANNSSVTISQSGTSLTFTAVDSGADSNYAVSTSVSWNTLFANPSFTACLQGASCSLGTSSGTLTGGSDPSLGSQPLVTLYNYNALDDLTCVLQKGTDTSAFNFNTTPCLSASAMWRPRFFVYDSLSRLTSATNPEAGTTTYNYDANGNLVSKIGPRPSTTAGSLTTNYGYDTLNRLISRTYVSNSTQGAQYGYDGVALSGCNTGKPSLSSPTNLIGRRSEMCAGPSHSLFSYDPMGRVAAEARKQVASGSAYTKNTGYTYYPDGELKTLKYPSTNIVTYTPSSAGRIINISDSNTNYVGPPTTAPMYMPAGVIVGMTNGAGIQTANAFNKRLQPAVLQVSTTAATFMSLSYDFHLGKGDNGNVFQVVNNLDSTRSRGFQYDALNRLTQANTTTTTGSNCWGEVYTVDSWGNLTNRNGVSGMTGCNYESLSASPASAKNQLNGPLYDVAGDVTNDGNGNTPTYDAEARIATVAGVTYDYDADGVRVRKNPGGLYWPDATGNVLAESDLFGNINEEYVFFNGARIARVDRPSGTAHYYFSDHLGSHTVVTNASGQCEQDIDYYPYGGIISDYCPSPVAQRYKFTGKERDAESGLDNFGARYNASRLARFMTPDSTGYSSMANPQAWNLYAYTVNNPLRYVDPSGHIVECMSAPQDCGDALAAATASTEAAKRVTTKTTTEHHKFLFFKWDTTRTIIAITGDIQSFRALSQNASKLADLVVDHRTFQFSISPTYTAFQGAERTTPGGMTQTPSEKYSIPDGVSGVVTVNPNPSPFDSDTLGVLNGKSGVIPGANVGETSAHELLGHLWGEYFNGDAPGTQANKLDSIRAEDAVRATDPTRGQKITHQGTNVYGPNP